MTARRLLHITIALIAWAAVLVQLVLSVSHGLARGESLARALGDYFGYFTILTNLLVACVLTVPSLAPSSAAGRWLADARVTWSAAAAIVLVGVAYHLLLSQLFNPTGLEAVTDLGLHYLVPPLYTLYWVAFADAPALAWPRAALPLALYPLGYFAVIMGRGAVVGRYPYFFVDVGQLGFPAAFRNALGLLACYLVVAWLLQRAARLRRVPA